MKHTADDDTTGSSDGDTRPGKLSKNTSGSTITLHERRIERAQDQVAGEAAKVVEGVAQKLDSNPNGLGEVVFNSTGLGAAIKHLVNVVVGQPHIYPMENASGVTARDADPIPTSELSEAEVRAQLTKGVVESVQDPMWSRHADDADPILQVRGMRKITGGSATNHGRQLSPYMLTLIDGNGSLINARAAVVRTEDVAGLRRGYVLKLKEFHRIYMAQHSDKYSSAGMGLIEYEVVGAGPVPMLQTGFHHTAAQPQDVASLQSQSAADSNADDVDQAYDPLGGWDDSKRKPEVPEERCTTTNRTCSLYGTHFFCKCVCEEYPVAERDLDELAKVYFAANTPVCDMTNSMKRNMLYWCYATDVYHVRGWLNRLPLPPCIVFEIRKMYPNDRNSPYKEFQESNPN